MSTRSLVGYALDGGFLGRYCHMDGYPTSRGQQLLDTYRQLGDWQAVKHYAIREGQTGYWSSYMPPVAAAEMAALPDRVPCTLCGGTGVRDDEYVRGTCNGCAGTGMGHNFAKPASWVDADDELMTASPNSDIEWVYLLGEKGIAVLSPAYEDGARWALRGTVAWDAPAVDWTAIECGEHFERCPHYAWAHFAGVDKTDDITTRDYLARRATKEGTS